MEPWKAQTAKQGVKAGFNFSTKKTGVIKNNKLAADARKPGDSNTANGTKSASGHHFFTADGLRVPLYDARGKRITQARDGRAVAHKISRQRLLDEYVRKYAGNDKVDEMEGKTQGAQKWSKNQIGDWITEVETRAYGRGPKGRTVKERKEGDGASTQSNGLEEREEAPMGRVTRSMSEQIMAMLAMGGETADVSAPIPVSKKAPVGAKNVVVTNGGRVVTTNGDANSKRKLPAQDPQATNKKPKLDRTNAGLPYSIIQKPAAATPAQSTSITKAPFNQKAVSTDDILPRKRKPGVAADMPPPKRKPATALSPTASKSIAARPAAPSTNSQTIKAPPGSKPQPKPPSLNTFDWNHAKDDLYLPGSVSRLNKAEPHPFLSTFSLDPTFETTPGCTANTTPLRALSLPASRSHLIMSTTALKLDSTSVHLVAIPDRDLENQRAAAAVKKKVGPPHRRKRNMIPAFLKPGTHGWDYEKHMWGFKGDKDLETGRGHQVDPEDERRVQVGEMAWSEFGEKYPGVKGRGGMWPCGCVVEGSGESEEE
ncbi:hypothetical protein PSPO01_13715 [Paraphaeosphaeria sporulosa]